MAGGSGNDTFQYTRGNDTILDWEVGDRIDLRTVAGLTTFAQLRNSAVQENGGTTFELSVGDLTLVGTSLSEIGPLSDTFLI